MKKSLIIAFVVLVAASIFVGYQTQVGDQAIQESNNPEQAAVLALSPIEVAERISSEWKGSNKFFAQINAANLANSPGAREGCTHCHNGMVFAGGVHTNAPIGDHMTGINCQACHTGTGNELMKTGQINPAMRHFTGTYIKSDITGGRAGKGALCITCHNGRRDPQASLAAFTAGTGNMQYPHYGAASLVFGQGGMHLPEATYRSSAAHSNIQDSCVGCHMVETQEGYSQHTFILDEADANKACGNCHVGAQNFNINGSQTEVYNGLKRVYDALLEATGAARIETSGQGGFLFYDQAGATFQHRPTPEVYSLLYNWYLVKSDGSLGVHNPAYARALLGESYRAVTGKGLW
ncbi:hypothetical protein BHU72_04200 [Desulfuribacillus stibiiarsenatis]|uniref:Cytochrome c-552/4 domain-containing protein n=1 Tax=Desulfuribacillus stibiiarsenatis TaxID=1390249 RepID=A0A1E5L5M2_9FIRM|nr:cytochrome c3 family protein [Desulfuribacillus stibiiarsenatis]OEH85303.1 hypothetical protein BHU72_04200 [Desulfuribacillus stibiiarsenatis]